MKEIEFTIDENGEVEIDLKGYNGKGCHLVAEAFIKALGKAKTTNKKQEFWQTEVKQKQKIKNG